jgi:hypothetical protein
MHDMGGWEEFEWWESDRLAIGVLFDANGRVIDKRIRIRILDNDS